MSANFEQERHEQWLEKHRMPLDAFAQMFRDLGLSPDDEHDEADQADPAGLPRLHHPSLGKQEPTPEDIAIQKEIAETLRWSIEEVETIVFVCNDEGVPMIAFLDSTGQVVME